MKSKHSFKSTLAVIIFTASATLSHGYEETYTKIPPLPKITIANFARTNETFDFVTANGQGEKTFWDVKFSISSKGIITGSAKVEKYKADGSSDGTPVTVKITSGRLTPAINPIAPVNSVLTDEGDNEKEQRADYRVDVIIKFDNGFVARGKVTYEHSIYFYPGEMTTVNGVTTVAYYYGNHDSDEFPSISVTGPNGHIGFIID